MKKIVVLFGIAAAAFGAMKMLKGGKEDEFAEPYQPYTAPSQG